MQKRMFYVWICALAVALVAVMTAVVIHSLRHREWYLSKSDRSFEMSQAIMLMSDLGYNTKTGNLLSAPAYYSSNGEPLGSWRFYMTFVWNSGGENAVPPYDLDKPWTQKRCRTMRPPEWCWDDDATGEAAYWTNVMAIVGDDTGFAWRYEEKLQDCDDLIVLMEVTNSGVHWAEPGDLHIDDITQESLSGFDGDGVLVCFLDREVWFLRKDTPVDLVKEFCTATGARKHDREKELSPYGFPI